MLEQLFGSRTRVKLLRLFLANPNQAFFVRELTRKIHEQINSIRRELANLEKMGFVASYTEDQKKYYQVSTDFMLYQELKSLMLKSRLTLEKKFLDSIKATGKLQYLVLTGYFVDDLEASVDLFIVGRINKNKLKLLLERFSDNFGQKLRYTEMDLDEYKYRKDITDKFLYDIINRKKVVVVDKIS